MEILTISRANLLDALRNHEVGEIAYAADVDKYFVYTEEGKWEETTIENPPSKESLKMTLYDMNKQLIKQMPIFDEARLKDAMETTRAWKKPLVNLYMLYGKEISYFTLFKKQVLANDDFVLALFKCLGDLGGQVYSFEVVDEDTIEIWIDYEGEPTCMYLFNYDAGVVIYNG